MSTSLTQITKNCKSESNANDSEFFSVRKVARLLGMSESSLRLVTQSSNLTTNRLVTFLATKGLSPANWSLEGVSINCVIAVAFYYGYENPSMCNPVAKAVWLYYQENKSLQGFKYTPTGEKTNNTPEKRCVAKLVSKHTTGKISLEVLTPVGRIDILTDTELIEVKEFRSWKSAIGQLLVYGSYYPTHRRRMHLFGKIEPNLLTIIQQHCKELNIRVTWDR